VTDPATLPVSEVDVRVYRAILSRYPQIDLFERVSSPEEWDVLYAVESLTNPRLRDEVGDIRLVAPEDRVYGEGASWIMAAFTHTPVDGRGGRFNKDFGIYYCSPTESVAVAESRNYPGHACYPCSYWPVFAANSFGVHYQSVRAEGGCIGVMRPRILSDAIHWRYLRYHYHKGEVVEVELLDGSAERAQ